MYRQSQARSGGQTSHALAQDSSSIGLNVNRAWPLTGGPQPLISKAEARALVSILKDKDGVEYCEVWRQTSSGFNIIAPRTAATHVQAAKRLIDLLPCSHPQTRVKESTRLDGSKLNLHNSSFTLH